MWKGPSAAEEDLPLSIGMGAPAAPIAPEKVRIPPFGLEGLLRVPKEPRGMVVFAHGSGSSRLSPRNNYVADALGAGLLGTLLLDLLTEPESEDRTNVFDIDLLAERLYHAARWLRTRDDTWHLPVGLFGASTGAAAALVAACHLRDVGAVVSRGGRPDLAGHVLHLVHTPTLLIVGGLDAEVLEVNRAALAELPCKKQLKIVPGATHLFEEPGALDMVVDLSRHWFQQHLRRQE
jgi:dienelactone hydrolase